MAYTQQEVETLKAELRRIVEEELRPELNSLQRRFDRLRRSLRDCEIEKQKFEKFKDEIIPKLCPTCQKLAQAIDEKVVGKLEPEQPRTSH